MQPWEVLGKRPLLHRQPWMTVSEEDVRLPNGTTINGYLLSQTREFVVVFAVLANSTVPLVRQYKRGPDHELLDLPAGYLDSAEEPGLEAAQRELREETGVGGGQWTHMGSYLLDSNRGDMRAHFYLVRNAQRLHAQELDDTEELTVSFQPLNELAGLVFSGQIESLPSAAGIMFGLAALSADVPAVTPGLVEQ